MNFFVQVRTTNLSLPPGERVRVWLGEPVIDWSTVKTREDIIPAMAQRDSYPATVIKREIVAKGKKALVIYGGWHFAKFDMLPKDSEGKVIGPDQVLRTLEHYPKAFFMVLPVGCLYFRPGSNVHRQKTASVDLTTANSCGSPALYPGKGMRTRPNSGTLSPWLDERSRAS